MTEKKKKKYATIGIDTSTELEDLVRQFVFEDIAAASTKDRQKLAPNEYTMRNTLMTAIFNLPINAGINFVSLQYMKTKWAKDNKGNFNDTGEKMIDGWQRTESQVDVVIEMVNRKPLVVRNWAGKAEGQTFDSDYEQVVATILEDTFDLEEEWPNLAFSVTGDSKMGKTHFLYSFPQPIKVYAFNRGAEFVKRKFPKADIDVVYFPLPVIDEENPKPWARPIWREFYKDFKETVGV